MKVRLNTLMLRALIILLPGLLYATSANASVAPYGEDGDEIPISEPIQLPNILDPLDLIRIRYPEGPAQERPTIIFLHGFGAAGFVLGSGDSFYDTLTNHFVTRGYNVIAPSKAIDASLFYLLGMGYPIRSNLIWWTGVLEGVAKLESEGRIDKSKFGVVGHSQGGGGVPYIAHKVAEKGWGNEGLFMAQLAPWYTHLLKDNDLANMPSHTKHLGIVFQNEDQPSHRMAIDIHHHLGVDELEKDFIHYNCGGHNLDSQTQAMVERHIDALAHYSFEGADASVGEGENEIFAREVALGVTPAGEVTAESRAIQAITPGVSCDASATDDPLGDGFGSDAREEGFDLSEWNGTLNFGSIPILDIELFTPFPAGPWLNARWYIWDDYYLYGIKRGTVFHHLSFLIRDHFQIGLLDWLAHLLEVLGDFIIPFTNAIGNASSIADSSNGVASIPDNSATSYSSISSAAPLSASSLTIFESNIGITLPKVVFVPEICGPEIPIWIWTGPFPWDGYWSSFRICTPEVSLGPVYFNPVSIKASLDNLSVGELSGGEVVFPEVSEGVLNGTEAYTQPLDISMQDLAVGINIESNVLGITSVVSDILDFLGLDEVLDALDGNFSTTINIDEMRLPIDVSILGDETNGLRTNIFPTVGSSLFDTNIQLPDAFNVFGFGLAQKVVDRITSRVNSARDFILQRIFDGILGNMVAPAAQAMGVSDSLTIGPITDFNANPEPEPEPEPDENCIDFGGLLGEVCLPFLTPFPALP